MGNPNMGLLFTPKGNWVLRMRSSQLGNKRRQPMEYIKCNVSITMNAK